MIAHEDLHRAIERLAKNYKKRKKGVTLSLSTQKYSFVLKPDGQFTVTARS